MFFGNIGKGRETKLCFVLENWLYRFFRANGVESRKKTVMQRTIGSKQNRKEARSFVEVLGLKQNSKTECASISLSKRI
jgi:hypothetical protein